MRLEDSAGLILRLAYNEKISKHDFNSMDLYTQKVSLVSGDMDIIASTACLAAVSPYLRVLLSYERLEDDKPDRIIIRNIEQSILGDIVEFIENSTIDITESNLYDLMSAGDMLQISTLRICASHFMLKTLNKDNCINRYAASNYYNYRDIADIAFRYCANHLHCIAESSELLDLPYNLFINFFVSRLGNVCNESEYIEMASAWVNREREKRHIYLSQLLPLIDLRQVSLEGLSKAENNEVLKSQISFQRLLRQAIIEKQEESSGVRPPQQYIFDCNTRYPSEQEVILAIGGECEGVDLRSVECLLPNTHAWRCQIARYLIKGEPSKITEAVDVLRHYRAESAAASDFYTVYIMGGKRYTPAAVTCEAYDVKANIWSLLPPMLENVESGAAVLCDGRIFLSGGRHSSNLLELHPSWNAWKRNPPLPKSRCSHCMVSVHGFLYILGGLEGADELPTSSVLRFDIMSREWLNLTCMFVARSCFAAVVCDGYIYVLGGKNEQDVLKSGERYNVLSNTWSAIADMPSPRHSFSATLSGKSIVCMGGRDSLRALDTVSIYIPESDRWHSAVSMLRARCSLAAATILVPKIKKQEL